VSGVPTVGTPAPPQPTPRREFEDGDGGSEQSSSIGHHHRIFSLSSGFGCGSVGGH
jgi:hypothetical protein